MTERPLPFNKGIVKLTESDFLIDGPSIWLALGPLVVNIRCDRAAMVVEVYPNGDEASPQLHRIVARWDEATQGQGATHTPGMIVVKDVGLLSQVFGRIEAAVSSVDLLVRWADYPHTHTPCQTSDLKMADPDQVNTFMEEQFS